MKRLIRSVQSTATRNDAVHRTVSMTGSQFRVFSGISFCDLIPNANSDIPFQIEIFNQTVRVLFCFIWLLAYEILSQFQLVALS